MNKSIIFVGGSLIIVGLIVLLGANYGRQSLQLGGVSASKCNVSSTEVASVGDDTSSTLLAANEVRAWAQIQNRFNATNTVHLSFDEGAAAVLHQGFFVAPTSTSPEFGRATRFPYTGAVTGITDSGTSTVLITECSF